MLHRLRSKHPGTPLVSILLYEVLRQSLHLWQLLFYRSRWYGVENVPATGPVLLVCNHQSFIDPPVVGCPIPRHLDFIARLGLFDSRGFGWLINILHATPIKEEGGDTGAIKEVLRRLGEGRAVLIFPEGSRTFTGAIDTFKRGAAVLVKRSRCPVVPVAIEGCFDAWPRTRLRPRLWGQRVAVMYGRPISHNELMAGGADAALVRLRTQIDGMRRELRERLRRATGGAFPPRNAGDDPISDPAAGPPPGAPSAGASRTAA